jgi:hypothetical protein
MEILQVIYYILYTIFYIILYYIYYSILYTVYYTLYTILYTLLLLTLSYTCLASNILVNSKDDIVLIDFGLAVSQCSIEDKAVDLYVLERSFISSHPDCESTVRSIVYSTYIQYSIKYNILDAESCS